jgi:hypothetical protein
MRCVVLLLATATGFMAFGLGAVASYVFGPAMCVLLLVCLAVWVGWVLYDCWFLSDLDDDALALVSGRWFGRVAL